MSSDHPPGSWSPHPASQDFVGVPAGEMGGATYRVVPHDNRGTVMESQPPYASGFVEESTSAAIAMNTAVAMQAGPVGPFSKPRLPGGATFAGGVGPVPAHRKQVLGPMGDDVAAATHRVIPRRGYVQ